MKTRLLTMLLLGVVVFTSLSSVSYAAEMKEGTTAETVTDETEVVEAPVEESTEEITDVTTEVTENPAEEDIEVVEGEDKLYGTTSGTATAISNGQTVTNGWSYEAAQASGNVSKYFGTSHWYKFTTTKRGYVTVRLKKDENPVSNLSVADVEVYETGNSNPILKDEASYGNGWDCTTRRLAYDAGKTLLIKVSSGYSSVPFSGNYELTVNQTPVLNWETENNNSTTTADPLVNNEIYGELLDYNDKDFYSFKITKKSKVHIKLMLDKADLGKVGWGWSAYLYQAGNGKFIAEKHNWNAESTWTPKSNNYNYDLKDYPDLVLNPGTYYIGVEDYLSNTEETYHLKVSTTAIESVTMYRMYNPNSGEHFYTADANERDVLKSVGWKYEGIAWTAPKKSNTPVYRLYNKNSGEHHYTTSAAEKNMLLGIGWSDEGIGWYSDDNMTTSLYRLYNPNAKGAQEAGAHHYTTDTSERDSLYKIGWKKEGTGWYGL